MHGSLPKQQGRKVHTHNQHTQPSQPARTTLPSWPPPHRHHCHCHHPCCCCCQHFRTVEAAAVAAGGHGSGNAKAAGQSFAARKILDSSSLVLSSMHHQWHLGWEFQFLVPISGTPIVSRIPIPFSIPKIPVGNCF
jgi:hypothetical protein